MEKFLQRKICIILSIITMFVVYAQILEALQDELDFEVPAPMQSTLINTMPYNLLGKQLQTASYESREAASVVIAYYRDFFSSQGFKSLLEEKLAKTEIQRLRYKKNNLAVDIIVTPKPEGCEFAVAKYVQKPGEPDLEKIRPSVNDPMFALPKEDMEGEDVGVIPRPPDSVRLGSIKQGERILLSYTSLLSVEELKDFYKLNMAYQAWELQRELSTGEIANDYKKTTGKKNLNLVSPFIDGENLERIVQDGYMLDFRGRYGYARMNIFPNLVDRDLGSLVHIVYTQSQSQE